MENQNKYNINLDVRYDHLERIDVPAIVAECTDKWFNQTLTRVNESVVRIGSAAQATCTSENCDADGGNSFGKANG